MDSTINAKSGETLYMWLQGMSEYFRVKKVFLLPFYRGPKVNRNSLGYYFGHKEIFTVINKMVMYLFYNIDQGF